MQDLYITMDRRDVVVDIAYNPPLSYCPKNHCGTSAPEPPAGLGPTRGDE
jgi:hypothetical protein